MKEHSAAAGLPYIPASAGTRPAFAGLLLYVAVFELGYKALTFFVAKPLLAGIVQFALNITGYQLAVNTSMIEFVFTVPGFVAAVLVLLLAGLLVYYEYAVIAVFAYAWQNETQFTLLGGMRVAADALPGLRHWSFILFALYALGLLPLANLGLSPSLLPNLSLPNFVTGELAKTGLGNVALMLIAVLVPLLFFVTVFTLPAMVLRGLHFAAALKENFRVIWRAKRGLVLFFAAFLAAWFILYRLPALFWNTLLGVPDVTLPMIWGTYGFSGEGVVLAAFWLLTSFAYLLLTPVLLCIVVGAYQRMVPKDDLSVNLQDKRFARWPLRAFSLEKPRAFWKKYAGKLWFRATSVVVCLVLLGGLGIGLVRIFEKGLALHPPIVIGHRGSLEGVENTLEAIQGAIDAGADYAEFDVLLSSDGIPMVVHDTNLARLTGENVNVYDHTALQLQALTLQQGGYTGKISTLEEALLFCRGKIKPAIEFKSHGYETQSLVDAVLEVLDRHGMAEESIFVSMEYDFLVELDEKRPELLGGYCLFGTLGQLDPALVRTMQVDFVIVEEAMATPAIIKDFRRAWLPVYVWTVNDYFKMEQYLDMGVLGLISDYPEDAAQAVREYNRRANVAYLPENEQMFYRGQKPFEPI